LFSCVHACFYYCTIYPYVYFNVRFTIVSTGGTASALESAGVAVTKVEQLTQFPEMVSVFVV
jgi:AICAR transformylase/IMP cyclohydrolase PurH